MNIDLNKLDRAISGAWKDTVNAYAENCQAAIESDVWEWDGTTLRKNGEIASSPRDIVDLGELRDSQQEPVYEGDKATISWDCEHATFVHDGTEKMQARPWTEKAAEETDFSGIMAESLKRRLQ